ncbi:ribonuclease Z [Membranihabitans marinus]|uniref:ribonuclease Z n=1 Tax=Membranihabitans marinus TaxID=1227546 RepID=UPI001EFFE714|nr:ribonuclease Z [Membranihabitans marinus]
MSWGIHILGANSAVPIRHRYPSAQILELGSQSVLIDCGEGTQIRMLEQQVKRSKISVICISHLHGDHVFGLPGLLTTYNLYGRQEDLVLIGPKGLKDFVDVVVRATGHQFVYPLNIIEMEHEGSAVVYEDQGYSISAFPLQHRIPTYGYRIDEKSTRLYLDKGKVKSRGLSHVQIQSMMKHGFVHIDGEDVPLSYFQRDRELLSYGYVSDTKYFESCADFVKGVVTLYHESTFLNEDEELAGQRYHSTAGQAAQIARLGQCKHLLLGHYSSRYDNLTPFYNEAREVFQSVFLGLSGKRFTMYSDGRMKELSEE